MTDCAAVATKVRAPAMFEGLVYKIPGQKPRQRAVKPVVLLKKDPIALPSRYIHGFCRGPQLSEIPGGGMLWLLQVTTDPSSRIAAKACREGHILGIGTIDRLRGELLGGGVDLNPKPYARIARGCPKDISISYRVLKTFTTLGTYHVKICVHSVLRRIPVLRDETYVIPR